MKEKETEKKKLYVVMNTFSGSYFEENDGRNIGHECINFFTPESGANNKHLLWFNSDGKFNSTYANCDGNITLIMVTNFAAEIDKYRILAVAKNCSIIPGVKIPTNSYNAKQDRYNEFINSSYGNASYFGKKIVEIFKDNTYQGVLEGNNTLATFYTEPENVLIPKDANATITIKNIDEENLGKIHTDINQNFSNEKMRMYITEDNELAIKTLLDIENSNKWIQINSVEDQPPRYSTNLANYKQDESFFTATKTEKNELVLSNIIAHSINYSLSNSNESKLLSTLLKDLDIKTTGNDFKNVKCTREDKDVDIRLELDDCIIVIENKIEADVVEIKADNPRKKIEETILKAYKVLEQEPTKSIYEDVKDQVIDLLDKAKEGQIYSQLTKYFVQANADALRDKLINSRKKPKKVYCFLLAPKYNVKKFENQSGFVHGDKYTLITYDSLINAFKTLDDNYRYKKDILTELKLLGSEVDDSKLKKEIYKFLIKVGF